MVWTYKNVVDLRKKSQQIDAEITDEEIGNLKEYIEIKSDIIEDPDINSKKHDQVQLQNAKNLVDMIV